MEITEDGVVRKPLQPAFLVKATGQSDITVSDGTITILFGTEIVDIGDNFASNVFNAPVTGRYQLSFQVLVSGLDIDANYLGMQLTTSNRNYSGNIIDPGVLSSDPNYWTFNISILADMDASDTAEIRWRQGAGLATADVSGDSYFSGFLAC